MIIPLKKLILLQGIVWLLIPRLGAQTDIPSTLSIQNVFEQVQKYHPMSVRAMMQNEFASASMLKAKGSFDPTAQSSIMQKNFANKNYYSLINGEIKIPTWSGIDIKGGYEMNRGLFLGPENNTPDNGLFYGGVSVPLGQGLFIDERRAEVKNAQIGLEAAILQQKDITNEILYQSMFSYWEWFRSYHIRQILIEADQNANQRFQSIKSYVENGDRPSIDTVEANIQIQNIRLSLSQAELDLVKSSTVLSGFYWNDDMQNIGINSNAKPEELATVTLNAQSRADFFDDPLVTSSHPYLEVLRQKIKQINIEQRLKRDKLKPQLNFQYNPLAEAFGNDVNANLSLNNYKWGMEFKMPFFLRKERGDVKIADLKLQEIDLVLQEKANDFSIKFENFYNEWNATLDQIQLFSNAVDLYKQMLDAERRLLDIGESSIFLVNAREQVYIQARIKLIEILVKNKLAYYSIYYFAGKLPELAN